MSKFLLGLLCTSSILASEKQENIEKRQNVFNEKEIIEEKKETDPKEKCSFNDCCFGSDFDFVETDEKKEIHDIWERLVKKNNFKIIPSMTKEKFYLKVILPDEGITSLKGKLSLFFYRYENSEKKPADKMFAPFKDPNNWLESGININNYIKNSFLNDEQNNSFCIVPKIHDYSSIGIEIKCEGEDESIVLQEAKIQSSVNSKDVNIKELDDENEKFNFNENFFMEDKKPIDSDYKKVWENLLKSNNIELKIGDCWKIIFPEDVEDLELLQGKLLLNFYSNKQPIGNVFSAYKNNTPLWKHVNINKIIKTTFLEKKIYMTETHNHEKNNVWNSFCLKPLRKDLLDIELSITCVGLEGEIFLKNQSKVSDSILRNKNLSDKTAIEIQKSNVEIKKFEEQYNEVWEKLLNSQKKIKLLILKDYWKIIFPEDIENLELLKGKLWLNFYKNGDLISEAFTPFKNPTPLNKTENINTTIKSSFLAKKIKDFKSHKLTENFAWNSFCLKPLIKNLQNISFSIVCENAEGKIILEGTDVSLVNKSTNEELLKKTVEEKMLTTFEKVDNNTEEFTSEQVNINKIAGFKIKENFFSEDENKNIADIKNENIFIDSIQFSENNVPSISNFSEVISSSNLNKIQSLDSNTFPNINASVGNFNKQSFAKMSFNGTFFKIDCSEIMNMKNIKNRLCVFFEDGEGNRISGKNIFKPVQNNNKTEIESGTMLKNIKKTFGTNKDYTFCLKRAQGYPAKIKMYLSEGINNEKFYIIYEDTDLISL